MPLISGYVTIPAPEPPPSPPPAVAPKRIRWTSPGGDVVPLSDAAVGYVSLPGRSGFGLPPREVVYDAAPNGGGVLRSIHDQVRVISLPLRIQGSSQQEYLTRLQRLQRAFRHRLGGEDLPGTLTVDLPDGTHRSIQAFYNGGLDGEESVMDDLLLYQQVFPQLEFLALDPYWMGDTVGDNWKVEDTSAFFGTMPVPLVATQSLGSVTIDVPGDADAYPIWTITGPGAPTLTNNTTGRSLAFDGGSPIASGRVVTIDTREDRLTVVDDLGDSYWSSLEPYPDLWTLEPGVNELTVSVASATSDTQVSVTATVRWQTGW